MRKLAAEAGAERNLGGLYRAVAGTSTVLAQTSAIIQPIRVQPRNKFSRKMEMVFRLCRTRATMVGAK